MPPEYLDALLTDRALGELSPEVAALLDAFLAQNPTAAARAADFAATLQLARTAVATPRQQPAALDLARLRRESFPARRRFLPAEALRLAACLALGLGLGWTLRRVPPERSPVTPPSFSAQPSRVAPTTTHFWSVSRFAPDLAKTLPEKSL